MKKYFIIACVIAFIGLIGSLVYNIHESKTYEDKWKTAMANVKAYDELLSDSKNKSTAYEFTINQLNNAKDSTIRELNELKKKLKIKDKNLISVQNIKTGYSRTDTIYFTDTIFRDKELLIDTIIGDEWYKAKVALKYPHTIIINPTFTSDKSIIVSTKKETVNPPKKLWILRLFQKKQTVLNVDVIEKNPYVQQESSRYIKIIK